MATNDATQESTVGRRKSSAAWAAMKKVKTAAFDKPGSDTGPVETGLPSLHVIGQSESGCVVLGRLGLMHKSKMLSYIIMCNALMV
ncbi:hypothetical protein DPMN_014683 [Dreissena polymorpha]|uniref:Uncharacterized protein n=1 Tax=Dreissena polymorpha TaxID=45954 RepID=A0A9D4N6F8_DREPO|nr:hypothetical protein DPMN_014683 [Dreissena polymorpha]